MSQRAAAPPIQFSPTSDTPTPPATPAVKESDGGNPIFIIIISGLLGLVVVSVVASFLIKMIMDRRTRETNETEEVNENYGNLDPGEYYEEEKKSQIVHSNDYY